MLVGLIALFVAVPVAQSIVQPAADVGPPEPAYNYMRVKSGKSSAQATSGSYCLPLKGAPTTQTCHTAPVYPLPGLATVTAKRGASVTMTLQAPAGYVTWRAVRISGGKERVSASGEAHTVGTSKKTWRLTLPRNLSRKVTVLGFNVTYLNAYNTYEVGIKVR